MLEIQVKYFNEIPIGFVQSASQRLLQIPHTKLHAQSDVILFPWYWPFSWDVYKGFQRFLPGQFKLSKEARDEYKKQNALFKRFQSNEYPIDLPDDFFRYPPYEHQKEGIALATSTPGCGWFFDRGLGKTKTAIETVRIRKRMYGDSRTLIITPPVTIPGWKKEIAFHSFGELTCVEYRGPKKDKHLEEDVDIVLTTYATARQHFQKLIKGGHRPFHAIIADESHRLRNPKSKTTKAVLQIASKIPFRTIMTGSPAWDPRHLYAQFRFINPCLVPEGSFFNFQNKYVVFQPYNKFAVKGFRNMNELRRRASSCCLFRTKEECLDLPERVIVDVPVELSKEEMKAYKDFTSVGKTEINGKTAEMPFDSPINLINSLLQISRGWVNESQKDPYICDECPHMMNCIQKKIQPYTSACHVEKVAPEPILHRIGKTTVLTKTLEMTKEIIEESVENKVIVWFRTNQSLRLFKEMLEGTPHVTLIGGADYGKVVETFQNNDKIQICVGQIKCGIGITLTASAYTIYAEPTLSAEDYEQSIDRNYRAGQTKKVTVYRMIASGGIDQEVLNVVENGNLIGNSMVDPNFCNDCTAQGKCRLGKSATVPCSLKQLVTKCKIKVRK